MFYKSLIKMACIESFCQVTLLFTVIRATFHHALWFSYKKYFLSYKSFFCLERKTLKSVALLLYSKTLIVFQFWCLVA